MPSDAARPAKYKYRLQFVPSAWAEWQSQVTDLRRVTDQIVPRPPHDPMRWVDLRNPNHNAEGGNASGNGVENVVGSGMTLEEYNASIDARNAARAISEAATPTATTHAAKGRRRAKSAKGETAPALFSESAAADMATDAA
jgi:hypothetical protein